MKQQLPIFLLIGGFVLLLVLPSLEGSLHVLPTFENTENRKLADFPSLDSSHQLLAFPTGFDTWYQDHFPLRNQFLRSHQRLQTFGFQKSGTGRVIMGQKEWLYSGASDWVFLHGGGKFSQQELQQLANGLAHREKALRAQNCHYYLVIIPNKLSAYPEYVPPYLQDLDIETRTDQVVEHLQNESSLKMLDLRPILQASKDKYPGNYIYYKHDSHWNFVGAFIGYEAIMEMLQQDFPEMQALPFATFGWESQVVRQGDYARMMGFPKSFPDTIFDAVDKWQFVTKAPKVPYRVPKDVPYKPNYERVYTACAPTGHRMVLLRDSFGSFLMPFLSAHFDRSVYIFDSWKYRYKKEIVEQEQPTVYIDLVLESSLHGLHRNRWKNLTD
ncbi:MAG: hypothetical protein AAF587_29730 [Bacteroidota bacterium]